MTVLVAVLLTVSAVVLVAGVAWRVVDYARTPAPLKIPTTPAPVTRGGVVLRMAREVILFESLFRGNLWTWAFGWLFHAGLALVLLRHLRYFVEPVPAWLAAVQPFGKWAGVVMAAGLAGLWARRTLVPRVRYISTPSDHLWLALLLAIAATGLAMTFAFPVDIVGVKAYALGLVRLDWQALPPDALVWAHLVLVAALMLLFPFSKLLHAPGIFFSPTRNQADDPRERRHLAPWAAELERER